MTGSEKLLAEEQKRDMYNFHNGRCWICHERIRYSTAQLAHRIPQTKGYLKKYGAKVIHHRLNMMITCPLCNSSALLDPKTHPGEAAALAERIETELGNNFVPEAVYNDE